MMMALAIVLSQLPCSALAAGITYGDTPIYIGHVATDYMAEEILKEIPTKGKSPKEQIRAVYDWIIKNCSRDNWDGTYYFDEAQVEQWATANRDAMQAQADNGEILVRREYDDGSVYDDNSGNYFFVLSPDSSVYINTFASEMMYTRTGNCAHYSALLALLLGHLGFDCRLIAGDFINGNGSQVEHKWNYVLVDGQYYWLDVRMDHANYTRTGKINYQYFMISDTNEWAKRHSWDHEYSDWLAANAADIADLYAFDAALNSGRPWARCSDWAASYMEQADNLGLLPWQLYAEDLRQDISRAEFAAVAVSMYEALTGKTVPEYTGANPFDDTDDEDVLRAYSLGVVNGNGAGGFSPDDTLTREQAATMLGRVYELISTGAVGDGSKLSQTGVKAFADDSSISGYARNYIYFFAGQDIINGVGNGKFAPKTPMTRESALKISVVTAEKL